MKLISEGKAAFSPGAQPFIGITAIDLAFNLKQCVDRLTASKTMGEMTIAGLFFLVAFPMSASSKKYLLCAQQKATVIGAGLCPVSNTMH
jgi:hypothetical protein